MSEQQTENKKTRGMGIRRLVQGRWLPSSVYQRNIISVIILVVLSLTYITFKCSAQMELAEIIALRNELASERTELVKVTAEYSSRILESRMVEELDSLKLNLRVAEQPPYYLNSEEDEDK